MLQQPQALAAFPVDHPLHELARMRAHLAEHPVVEEIFLSDPPGRLEHEVWISVQMRGRPTDADPDMERFADKVARRFGWHTDHVEEIGWDGLPEYWSLLWEPA